jgi:hydrogenase-4 component F
MLLALLTSLAGMPPFGIFLGELLLVMAGVAAHSWAALAVGLVGMGFAFAALSRAAIQIESGRPGSHPPKRVLSRVAVAAAAVALVGAIGIAIVPWTPLVATLQHTAQQIGGGQ